MSTNTRNLSLAVCLVSLAILGPVAAPAQVAPGRQVVEGHLPKVNAPLQSKGRLEATKQLNLTIGLPLRNREVLANLLHRIYDRTSPDYRHYLTPAQFTELFGPAEPDYQSVIAFAKAHGLAVKATHPNRMLLEVSGAVADIEQALHVQFGVYEHPTEQRTFFAADVEPSLELAVPLLDISGLNNYARPRPRLKTTPVKQRKASTANLGSGPYSGYIGSDFRAAYIPGSALTGVAQTLGLLEFDGYTASDITYYENLAGLPEVPLTNVLLDGANGLPSGTGGEVEVSLDIEVAISMAPGLSELVVYEGNEWHTILNRMATDDVAKQLSCSWYIPGGGPDPVADQIWQQMAAQGQSFFNASGDSGAYSGPIDFPGDTPYITQVGGTTLTTTGPGGSYVSETVWNWGNGDASSGGVSTSYPIPSWQAGVSMTANQGSTTMRNTPDVALTADNVYVRVDGQDENVGGTSCAAPLWAGFTALVNQQAAANGWSPVGFMNPQIYALGLEASYTLGLHDITTGSNATPFTPPGKFLAVLGYDLCTGWGTPNGSNLINALVPPADPLQISPGLGFAASGPTEGPFVPGAQRFSLKNLGTVAMNWSLVNTTAWLNVSATSGQVKAGGGAFMVPVGIGAVATNLPLGTYTTTVWFTNATTGFAQSRWFSLQVTNLPVVITLQPSNQMLLAEGTATFSVGATGTRPNYYWKKNGASLTDNGHLSGSATSTLTISGVTLTDAAIYSVVVSNSVGTVTSAGAALVVYSPGGGQLVQNGGFETGDFSDWTPTGNTNLTTVTTDAIGVHSGVYGAQFGASGSAGFLSQTVPTVPGAAYVISAWLDSPDGQSPNQCLVEWDGNILFNEANLGPLGWTNLQFTVTASSTSTVLEFGFQDDPSYLGLDDVVVTGYTNVASPPVILVQPVSQTVPPDDMATFSVVVTGNQPLSFAWMVNGNPIGGATQSNLTVNAQAYAGGQFSCLISNLYGSVSSAVASLTVAGPLYSFGGPDGGFPAAALIQAGDGSFYGTTEYGGAYGEGTILRMTTNGVLTTLVNFNYDNGANPQAGLLLGADGNFYGTTAEGGNYGAGTVFRMTPEGVLTNLAQFDYSGIGGNPAAALVQGADGNFYGTTEYGGTDYDGTVFRMDTNGTLTTLVSFNGTNGASSAAALVQGADGNFYGTTSEGGTNSYGTVFRVTTNGLLATLVNFDYNDNGAYPYGGLVQAPDGIFYGTTSDGGLNYGGTVFCMTTNGRLATLATFDYSNGANPQAGLLLGADGNFYGTTEAGGDSGVGTLFSMASDGTLNPLFSFAGTNGASPMSALVQGRDGNFYGTTTAGGWAFNGSSASGDGTVFCFLLSPGAATLAVVAQPVSQIIPVGGSVTFSVQAASSLPVNYFWRRNGATIAGAVQSSYTIPNAQLANSGSQFSCLVSNALGSVLSSNATLTVLSPNSSGPIYSFSGFNGGYPGAALIQAGDGTFYGTTEYGGSNYAGTVFRLTTNGLLTTLVNFNYANGAKPQAGLLLAADGNFYGTTAEGGIDGEGTVFRMTPEGALTTLAQFDYYDNGGYPEAALVQGADGNFYGTTSAGGTNYDGTVFQMDTNGTLTTLVAFNGTNGANPNAALVQGADGNFYGTTSSGGTNYDGTVFSLTTNGALTTLVNFDYYDNGGYPEAALVQGADGNFYGTTSSGGTNYDGTVFRLTPGGALTTLVNFDYSDGSYPYAGLVLGTDGNFYGTTENGGDYGDGTVFRFSVSTGLTNLFSFTGTNGATPQAALVQGNDGNFYGAALYGGMGFDGANNSGNGAIFRLIVPQPQGPPIITVQPVGQNVFVGGTASFSVSASGSAPLRYFWQRNGSFIVGATNATYTTNNVQLSYNNSYFSCVVSNALGFVVSSNAFLDVTLPPVNLVQNGGFETGDFTGWSLSGATNGASVTTDTNYVHSGNYGAQLGPSGSLGYLSQNLTTVTGSNYLLSLWLDNLGGPTNEFQVTWNGNNLFDGLNMNPFAWTNLQFVVTASSTSSTLQLGFRQDPSYFGLDDISVTPVGDGVAFGITKVTLLPNSAIQMTVTGSSGTALRVLGSTNLINWQTVVSLTNVSGTLQFSDPSAANLPCRFYRLVTP